MRLAFVAGIVHDACSASRPESAPPLTHRLTPGEVTRLFSEWACPGRPHLASVLVRLSPVAVDPESQAQSQGGRWIVLTSAGSVSFRESTRIFEPSEQASRALLELQGTDGCRP